MRWKGNGAPLLIDLSRTECTRLSNLTCAIVSCRVVSCRVVSCRVVSCRGVAFISKGDAVLVIGGEDGSGTPMSTVEVSENSPQ